MSTAAGPGRVFLPYQARWYALGRGSDAPWRWLEKSRRTGMTWAEAARQTVIAASSRSAGGRDCIYVSTSLVLARAYIDVVALWARAMQRPVAEMGLSVLRDGADDILAHEVRFESGFTVRGVSSNPAAMRGKGGEICIDETAHHQRLRELLEAAFALKFWGGNITALSTHNGLNNPFNKLGKDIRAGVIRGHTMRLDIHQALREGLYRRICKVNGRPWSAEGEARFLADCLASPGASQEFLVNPAESGSIFYRAELLAACARPAPLAYLARPEDWLSKKPEARAADVRVWCTQKLRPLLKALARDKVHYLGSDFARVRHLSAWYVLEKALDGTLTTPFFVELRNVPDEEQEIIGEYLLRGGHVGDGQPEVGLARARCSGVAIDTTEGGGRNLAEQLGGRWGRREDNASGLIVSVKLSAPWYAEQHHRLRHRLEERDLFIARDEDVLEDMQSWRTADDGAIKLGPETESHRDKLPRHGDVSIALLLAQSLAPLVAQASKYQERQRVVPARRGLVLP